MSKEKINILCSTDENYIPLCGIMLTSLFENNKKHDVEVFVMSSIKGDKEKQKLLDLANSYAQTLRFLDIDKNIFSNCPIRPSDYLTLAAYYRIIAPTILPNDIDKILYLDCDIIICGDLYELWNLDISNYSIAAARDVRAISLDVYKRLEYSPELSYFNSGVLVINVNYWRENSIIDRCFEFINKYQNDSQKLAAHDQDTLNVVLKDSKKLLPCKYNLSTGLLLNHHLMGHHSDDFRKEICDAIAKPVIIHFTADSKPWLKYAEHPYTKYFLKYMNISPWRKMKKKNVTPYYLFKYLIKHFLVTLKLRAPHYMLTIQEIPKDSIENK